MKGHKRKMAVLILAVLLLFTHSAVTAAPSRLASIKANIEHPVRVALDAQGNLYVAETARNTVLLYDRKGQYKRSLSVPGPLGIAVDSSGRIYIGSGSKKSVDVYNPDLTFAHSLGAGKDECQKPNSIAIDGNGNIYVVDSLKHVVRVYEPGGQLSFSFGSSGSTDGLFNKPTAIAVNDAAGEVYVTDLQIIQTSNGPANGARIQAFDKSGAFKRSFGQYGQNVGEIAKPMDIAIDKTGALYVADSHQNAVHILDPQTGESSGALYDLTNPLIIPLGVAVGRNGMAYVASYNGSSLEKYVLDGYVTMETSPADLAFEGREYGLDPAAQTVLIANGGEGTLTWTASADQPWISLGQTEGTTDPASMSELPIGVTIAGLAAGTHTGSITLTADFGQINTIPVSLTILPPPILSLSNGWLTFTTKKGTTPDPQVVSVGLENVTALSWSASTDSPWLSIAPAAGSQSAETVISVNTDGMNQGAYQGLITFSAPGAIGDASKITVDLTLTTSNSIKVSTNLEQATFTVSGPASLSGSGTSWSADNVPAGDYTITYGAAAGYQKPLSETRALADEGTLAFSADYRSLKELAARRNIIVAQGPGPQNSGMVKIYSADGSTNVLDLATLDTLYGASVASGDVDGDGTDEIIVGAGPGPQNPSVVGLFKTDGTKLHEFTPYATTYGVNIAAADLDGNGIAEILVAPGAGPDNPGMVKVYAYNRETKQMVPTGIDMTVHGSTYGANIAVADTEGDGLPELVTAPAGGPGTTDAAAITVWKVDTSRGMGNWSANEPKVMTLANTYGATLAAGDTDGDGKDEIIVGSGPDPNASAGVRIYGADGTERKQLTAFDTYRYGVTVAAADLDGDGKAEIIVGAGADPNAGNKMDTQGDTEHTLKAFSALGVLQFSVQPYAGTGYGVNVTIGELGL